MESLVFATSQKDDRAAFTLPNAMTVSGKKLSGHVIEGCFETTTTEQERTVSASNSESCMSLWEAGDSDGQIFSQCRHKCLLYLP